MSDQFPFDIIQEEAEAYNSLSRAGVAVYEFFNKFQISLGDESSSVATIRFGKTIEDDEVDKQIAKQIRLYVKIQKDSNSKRRSGF